MPEANQDHQEIADLEARLASVRAQGHQSLEEEAAAADKARYEAEKERLQAEIDYELAAQELLKKAREQRESAGSSSSDVSTGTSEYGNTSSSWYSSTGTEDDN